MVQSLFSLCSKRVEDLIKQSLNHSPPIPDTRIGKFLYWVHEKMYPYPEIGFSDPIAQDVNSLFLLSSKNTRTDWEKIWAAFIKKQFTLSQGNWTKIPSAERTVMFYFRFRIQALDFSNAEYLNDESMDEIFSVFPHVQKLNFSKTVLSKSSFLQMIKKIPMLKELILEGQNEITMHEIKELFQCCPKLETLIFRTCLKIDMHLFDLLDKYPLKHLTLDLCEGINDKDLLPTPKFKTSLESFKIVNCPNLSWASIRTLIKACPSLKKIETNYPDLNKK